MKKPVAPITGQAYVRHQGAAPDGSGRRLVTLLCVLAVPKEDLELFADGTQYVVLGRTLEFIGLMSGTGIDIDNQVAPGSLRPDCKPYYGMSLTQLSLSPIWRI